MAVTSHDSGIELNNLRSELMNQQSNMEQLRREQLADERKATEIIVNKIESFKSRQEIAFKEEQQIWKAQFDGCSRSLMCCSCFCCGCNEAANHFKTKVATQRDIMNASNRLFDESKKVLSIIDNVNFEKKTSRNGGVCGVYNPSNGKTEWREKWHHGVCGVFNPKTLQIEWKEKWNGDVHGVYNPIKQIIEWKEEWHHGVGGAWNVDKQQIEWKTKWNHGICGVWNPIKHTVEWKESWNGGICGYFDAEQGAVKWFEEWHHGVAVIYKDQSLNTFVASRGCCWDWSK